jgi:hypothetical protein
MDIVAFGGEGTIEYFKAGGGGGQKVQFKMYEIVAK